MSVSSPPEIASLLSLDPHLSDFKPQLDSIYTFYQKTLAQIQKHSSLKDFVRSYEEYGIHIQPDNSVRCKEWAPNLGKISVAGEFNSWDQEEWELEMVGSDIWMVTIPPDSTTGQCRIPSGTELRYFCRDKHGKKFDRISPWARYVTNKDRIYYNETFLPSVRYEWEHKPPGPPTSLYIYESHVGICTPDPKISSYVEFADTVIPRIAKLGYNTIQLMAVMEHAYYASFGYQVSELSNNH